MSRHIVISSDLIHILIAGIRRNQNVKDVEEQVLQMGLK